MEADRIISGIKCPKCGTCPNCGWPLDLLSVVDCKCVDYWSTNGFVICFNEDCRHEYNPVDNFVEVSP